MRLLVSGFVVLLYLGLLISVAWFIARRPGVRLTDKVSGLLQLLALYTFMLSLLSASGVFAGVGTLQRELASSDPLRFVRANAAMFAGLSGAMAVALHPGALSGYSVFTVPVLIVLELLLFMYAVVHFCVIAPMAYFAYVLTSVPVDAILRAPSDITFTFGKESVSIQAL